MRPTHLLPKWLLTCLGGVSLALTAWVWSGGARGEVVGSAILLNDNGAWSWFEDERIIVDPAAGKLLLSSVADSAGSGGIARNGNIELAALDLNTQAVSRFVLHQGLQADDHNAAALLVRPDGRYLAVWNTHGSTQLHYYRVSTNPGDPTLWQPLQTFNNGAGTTYANVYRLSDANDGAGRIFNFTRTVGFNPNYNISDDEGATWSYGGRLMSWTSADLAGDPDYTGVDGRRPYVRYTSNNTDEIHFITTEDHPRAYNNNIFHGYIKLVDGVAHVFQSDGTSLGPLSTTNTTSLKPNSFTQVFDGNADNVAWTSDIELDDEGRPYVAFTVQKDSAGLPAGQGGWDHRYFYGRWDGSQWQVNEMAFGGTKLYAGEDDYTGNIGLNPSDPNMVVISTDVHPVTKTQLIGADGARHHELFRGRTSDGGATWEWRPITFNSTVDNLRPILPKWNSENVAVAWMSGTYSSYTNYNLEVVAMVNPPDANPQVAAKVDFGLTGQIVQSGFSAFTHASDPLATSVTEAYASPFATPGEQLEITVGSDGPWGFRDRGDNVAGPVGRIQDDFVFATASLQLTFDNLAAGDYHLVLYSHDRDFAQSEFEIRMANRVLGRMTPQTSADPLVGTASARVAFTTDGTGPVELRLDPISAGAIVLNGLELYAVDFLAPVPLAGDLNGDQLIDVNDYAILLRRLHNDYSHLPPGQTLTLGDLNGDRIIGFQDLVVFRQIYEDANGPGSLARALAQAIPEPQTWAIVALCVAKYRIIRHYRSKTVSDRA